jgi:hypothetical protein
MKRTLPGELIVIFGLTVATALPALGGPPTLETNVANHAIYPAKGQTAEQQQQDQLDAYDWATKETNWDPYLEYQKLQEAGHVAAETADATRGEAVGGAARGALVGLAIGAIAGDAGQGAAIGAAAGGLTHGLRARRTRKRASSAAEQAKATYQHEFAIWDSYFVAAMEGKGYTVK